ncbi:LVIS_2131 family protein [Lacticaseibacillus jixianensis]|uniref:LVIS_2131 family protein n=1 Tax=Lacticaseibacillus jixianensis TaxID=2486012 RepID=A0ABW4B5Q9_9LACO|nr:LVIS_2131 family protein [Lacticaseibacillus jixianensis]
MWNYIGVAAWLLVVLYLIFIIWHIRARHLKMVVRGQKPGLTWLIDLIECGVLVLAVYSLVWAAWLRPIDYADSKVVAVKYDYHPLILQTGATRSYYVSVQSGNGTQPVRYFTYWTAGAKNQTNSRDADISDGTDPLTVKASVYPWHHSKLIKLDTAAEKAYVATMTAHYRKTFLNGLGMHVGHLAERFDLIRIPNETFLKVVPKQVE